MTLEEVKAKLAAAGLGVKEESRLPNGMGAQIRLTNEAVLCVYDSGKTVVQGRNREPVEAALSGALASGGVSVPVTQPPCKKVFVVYGHDPVRSQLDAMLRRWGLEPLILDQLPSDGQTIIEKLERAMSEASFGVVLATPDDEGYKAGHPTEKMSRARQNVVLELGMLLATLGRSRVAILLKDQQNMERPSDIQGLIYIPFKENLEKEAGPNLAKEMATKGFKIDVRNL